MITVTIWCIYVYTLHVYIYLCVSIIFFEHQPFLMLHHLISIHELINNGNHCPIIEFKMMPKNTNQRCLHHTHCHLYPQVLLLCLFTSPQHPHPLRMNSRPYVPYPVRPLNSPLWHLSHPHQHPLIPLTPPTVISLFPTHLSLCQVNPLHPSLSPYHNIDYPNVAYPLSSISPVWCLINSRSTFDHMGHHRP